MRSRPRKNRGALQNAAMANRTEQQQFADQVVDIRLSQQKVAQQTAYREEMAFVQSRNDLRRAMWWSLATYIVCIVSVVATLAFVANPGLFEHWHIVTLVVGALATSLAVEGIRRDRRHTNDSWTRMHFPFDAQAVKA